MGDGTAITSSDKERLIRALRTHQVNTVGDLRRIERVFAQIGTPDVSEPMTSAWAYYVNSHSLLTELRGLTRNYPFNSDCLDEAKRRVYSDPSSNRSWNFCWLVLTKIKSDNLIPYYAGYQASMPAMWGGRNPTTEGQKQLANAFTTEWTWAIDQMLRHWEEPPCR
ncbi:hypothetical protein NA57DRAFT_76936 [Rhizodiscina lignyota]|uniref:Uncharacterized protein n=1 Tax=Rhizodiscina lignyota TaxID=1504668 RepID=A0A9P4M8A1_9PEZI|nr:hypothetical protein NA57DRAFT_76936 [Rhizodiscina lignyota]